MKTLALRFTGNQHTLINTSVLTHTTHLNTSWGWSKQYNIGSKKNPPQPRGQRRNRNTSKQHWKHVATQTGPSPKALGIETPRKKRIEINAIAFISRNFLKFWKNLEESDQKHDIPVQFKPSNTLRQRLVHPKDKTCRLCNTVPGRMGNWMDILTPGIAIQGGKTASYGLPYEGGISCCNYSTLFKPAQGSVRNQSFLPELWPTGVRRRNYRVFDFNCRRGIRS